MIKWVNSKCPEGKIQSLEQLSDGRHFLLMLKSIYSQVRVDHLCPGNTLL